ncbi:MAG: hypothetical protein AVDCRST_MAG22-3566, partial [uncultured Rubrobacteraceae bacterium]
GLRVRHNPGDRLPLRSPYPDWLGAGLSAARGTLV